MCSWDNSLSFIQVLFLVHLATAQAHMFSCHLSHMLLFIQLYVWGHIAHDIVVLQRWKGGNGPEQTDSIATGNLIRATPKGVKRFVLVTSAGVERFNKLPFSILNLFGMPQRL